MNRQQAIINASIVGIVINSVLALLKISAGFWGNSLAVIGDGIDSSTDVVTYVITLFAARIMVRKPNPKFPFGYSRIETLATKLLSFFIFFIGAQLVLSSLGKLWSHQVNPSISILAMLATSISVLGKLGLSWWQMKQGKKWDSKMLIANAKNMQSDIFLSLGVLFGVSLAFYTGIAWLDPFVALVVGLWILKIAFDLFWETSAELMDSNDDPEVYKKIFEGVESVDGAHNPHKARARKISNLWVIDLDIEVDPDLPMSKVHDIGVAVETAIKERVENVYDIMIHFEPIGNKEKEPFGVAYEDLT